MKLYPKKLNSVEELKREQLRLKFERMHTKASDLMPIKELGRSRKSDRASKNLLGLAFDVVNSKSTPQTVLTLAGPVLKMLRGKKKAKEHHLYDGPRKKSALKSLISQIVVTYVIGKAFQLSLHAVKLYIRSRKNKKQREREAEYERNRGW